MPTPLQSRLHERAACWVARLRSDSVSEGDVRDFALWLNASAAHRQALDSMLELWDDLAVLAFEPVPEAREPVAGAGSRPWRWLGAGLAASLALLAIMFAPALDEPGPATVHQTSKGASETVALADASRVTLNTDTRISVRIDSGRRHVLLHRGEAYFQVVRDARQRPFVVDAGTAEVRVMGTAFNIRLHGGQSDITVTEGVVRVTERNNPGNRAAASELLYASQRIRSDAGGLAAVEQIEAAAATAWRDGKIVAEGMTLAALMRELGRYHDRKFLIADPELAQTRVSGVFSVADPDAMLKALEHSLGVNAMPLEGRDVLLIKAGL